MSIHRTRREFLADVAKGALVAGVGLGLARRLTPLGACADDLPDTLAFGPLEPLVALLQETPVDRLLPELVARIKAGTELRTLVAAGALANARTFGGEDYVGFHTFMALAPAYRMSEELEGPRKALPVLKVLHRNSARIQEFGGRSKEVLRRVEPSADAAGDQAAAVLAAVRAKDVAGAERSLAGISGGPPLALLGAVLPPMEDEPEVHRVVLPHRAWQLLDIVGPEHALTLLRQSVRYCVKQPARGGGDPAHARAVLPAVLDRHHLLGREPGRREVDDAWVDRTSRALFEATPPDAAELAAAALAEGVAPAALGEAISLAANQLVLRDAGRPAAEARPGKPEGSVHGDSIGVHASDSANAWRGLAGVARPNDAYACLILGAWQVARDRVARGGKFLEWKARPDPVELEKGAETSPEGLLRALGASIEANRQESACALAHRYGAAGHPPRAIFDVLLRYATSEDGALHAEKYYRTVSEEFAATRPALRWRHVVALARVTASEYGKRAAGFEEAVRLLGI